MGVFIGIIQNLKSSILRVSCHIESKNMSINFSDSVPLRYITLVGLVFGINLLPVHDSITWIICESTGSWYYVGLPNVGQFLYAILRNHIHWYCHIRKELKHWDAIKLVGTNTSFMIFVEKLKFITLNKCQFFSPSKWQTPNSEQPKLFC